jgi:hypothetical protein
MISIDDTKNIQTLRKKINVNLPGYGAVLPDPDFQPDGRLYVVGGVIYQNQLVATVPTWVAL